jgi:uncharacterized protein YqfA (UPF0365 family)
MTEEQEFELYEERAAIIEYEGERPRIIAEAMARADIEEMKRKFTNNEKSNGKRLSRTGKQNH